MPNDHAEAVALFRAEVIGALLHRQLDRGDLRAALRELSAQRLRPPGSAITRTFSVTTLERWYYAYRSGGLGALRPQGRSDRGHARELSAEQRQLLLDIRAERPAASVTLILRTLVADGRLAAGAISASTVRRLYAAHGLDRVPQRDGGRKVRLRWQAERPGALWHGDVCHGASLLLPSGATMPLRIHALLDDASRYVVAIEARHAEREVDMLELLVRALRRFGAPDALYLDNGATYTGTVLRLASERLGITLLHARPGDAPARGKMERFWRTLRGGCLDHLGSIASLHDVQARLLAFVDEHYHRAPHAGLLGQLPHDVFVAGQGDRGPDELTEERLRHALTVTERRRVRRDSTLSIDGQVWELDQGFLAGRVVTIGRCFLEKDAPPWVEVDGKRRPLHLVDPVANSRRARQSAPQRSAPTTPVDFDPPRTLLDRAIHRRPPRKGAR